MGGITNPLHLAFIAVIALIFLGPKRLPDLARTIGNGMREFRDAIGGESAHEPPEPSVGIEAVTPPAAPSATEPATAPAPPVSAPAPAPHDQVVVAAMNAAPSPSEQELAAPPTSAAS
jgi:sec-independent protein translocase protein TatA